MAAGLLIALALFLAFAAIMEMSQATLGVGLMALACLAGILARIAQAAAHHKARQEAPVRETVGTQGQ